MKILLSNLTPEQALEWLITNDIERGEDWRNASLDGLLDAVADNLNDFGYDSQRGHIIVVQNDAPIIDEDDSSLEAVKARSGTLLNMQPDENEPIEYTHFDCWFQDEEGNDSIQAFEEASEEALRLMCNSVILHWGHTLNIPDLHPRKRYEGAERDIYALIGVKGVLDLTIIRLLESGYNVYSGDSFIEIYSAESEE